MKDRKAFHWLLSQLHHFTHIENVNKFNLQLTLRSICFHIVFMWGCEWVCFYIFIAATHDCTVMWFSAKSPSSSSTKKCQARPFNIKYNINRNERYAPFDHKPLYSFGIRFYCFCSESWYAVCCNKMLYFLILKHFMRKQ